MVMVVYEGFLILILNVYIDRFNFCLCSVSKNIVVSVYYYFIFGE